MIIRLSLGDKNLSPYIEKFCDNLCDKLFSIDTHPELINPIDSILSLSDADKKNPEIMDKMFSKMVDYEKKAADLKDLNAKMANPEYVSRLTPHEHTIIQDEIMRLWNMYADDMIKHLKPTIHFTKIIQELNEGGEVVYYMTVFNKIITM